MPDVTIGATAAYLAVPATSPGPWPGVVAIHEAFGLNDDIRAHADRLAALGYLALAPDLLGGRFWMRCIRSMFRQIAAGSGPAFEVLDACRGWLAERPDSTGKTGVIGFCMGGGFALMCARGRGTPPRQSTTAWSRPTPRARWPGHARWSGATGPGTRWASRIRSVSRPR